MKPVLKLAELEDFLYREFPQVSDDYSLVSIGDGTAVVRMLPGDKHLRPGATVSGPTLFALADCAVYLCIIAMVGPEALAVTTNASIDFMAKPEAGRALEAKVELLKLGRGLVVGDVRIRSEGREQIVARGTFTYSRPRQ